MTTNLSEVKNGAAMIQVNGSMIQDRRKGNIFERLTQPGSLFSELWTVQDVAKFAKLSPSKIYRDAEAGLIPCKRWGKGGQGKKCVLRFLPTDILDWLDAGCPIPRLPNALAESPKTDKMLLRKTVGLGESL